MGTTEVEAIRKAMDEFYDAIERLLTEVTLIGVLRRYVQCLELVERIDPQLRAEFELDAFLVEVALERAVQSLAA